MRAAATFSMRIYAFLEFYATMILKFLYFPVVLMVLGVLVRYNTGDRNVTDLVLEPLISAIVAYLAIFLIISIGTHFWYTKLSEDIKIENIKARTLDDLRRLNELIIDRMRREKN